MYVYFDIGGTKTRVSISHDGKEFASPKKFDTPKDLNLLFTTLRSVARELGGDAPIEALGGGIACPVNRTGDVVTLCPAPHLPKEWFEQSFVDECTSFFGVPVYLDNDTAVIGLGEAVYGAGRGYEVVAYMTVSTGIGGARIVRERIESIGISTEPGRQYIDFDKSAFPGCERATIEGYASGTATERRFGMKPYEVHDPAVWEELARWCAYMLNNTIVHWSPDAVVLGGSMITGDPAIPVARISEHLRSILSYPRVPEIKQAGLGDFGGLYGAMELVRQRQTDNMRCTPCACHCNED
ncbi:MAG: ROK family protein [Candidatus Pacebacteria bacterium]|nr:ROK family protein [Candidatus Paceibacterota bacterium]